MMASALRTGKHVAGGYRDGQLVSSTAKWPKVKICGKKTLVQTLYNRE